MKAINAKSGFSLTESVIYIGMLALFVTFIAGALSYFFRSYSSLASARALESSALSSMERMVREVKRATAVDSLRSIFSSDNGRLAVLLTDETTGETKRVEFYTENGRVMVSEDGGPGSPLSSSSARVNSLRFEYMTGQYSKGIKMELSLFSGPESGGRSGVFRASAVMRNSYDNI